MALSQEYETAQKLLYDDLLAEIQKLDNVKLVASANFKPKGDHGINRYLGEIIIIPATNMEEVVEKLSANEEIGTPYISDNNRVQYMRSVVVESDLNFLKDKVIVSAEDAKFDFAGYLRNRGYIQV